MNRNFLAIVLLISSLLIVTISCKKDKSDPPVVSTASVTNISPTMAVSGGNVTDEGSSPLLSVGICWSTSAGPSIENNHTTESPGAGSFTSNLTQLTPNTLYYVRAYATNSNGTGYGNEISFTSSQIAMPTLTTTEVTLGSLTTAMTGGNISSDNGASVIARGVCWGTVQDPTVDDNKTSDGSGTGTFTSSMTGLASGTVYYIRAYATNSAGTAYGNQQTIQTDQSTVADIDGNIYGVIRIGTQVWMAENLKTTRFNDGSAIPLNTNNAFWQYTATSPGYCWYNNDEATNKNIYGALYNWYTVHAGNICPTGWHVPSKDEWITLGLYAGEHISGNKLKEAGNAHWSSPSTPATDDYGFTALPGGERYNSFSNLGISGAFWSNSSYDFQNGYAAKLNYNFGELGIYTYQMSTGVSVRCLRD